MPDANTPTSIVPAPIEEAADMMQAAPETLAANILDEFHGHQVEITSPAFRANRDANASTIPDVIPREQPQPEQQPWP